MRHVRVTEQAFRLAAESSRSPYVCRTCLAKAQSSRGLHTSAARQAERPFWQRMQESIFGEKDSQEAERKRNDAKQGKIDKILAEGQQQSETIRIREKDYRIAEFVDPTTNKDYVPANTWDGLERIGSDAWVKARRDQGEEYLSFIPQSKAHLSTEGWRRLLHHVAVEVLTLKKNRRQLNDVCNGRDLGSNTWSQTKNVAVRVNGSSNSASLAFALPQDEQVILEAVSRGAPPIEQSSQEMSEVTEDEGSQSEGSQLNELPVLTSNDIDATHLREIVNHGEVPEHDASLSSSMALPLTDPQVKLAILKRVTQLTGRRIPDLAITRALDLHGLHQALIVKPKPKKLTNAPQLKKLQSVAPNVTVYPRRRTPIDKEREVGRWKVIEGELLRRGLPVTGSRWVDSKINA